MSSKLIELVSSDGESFMVDEAVARELQIVAHMIDDDCADKPIPLTNVTSKYLALVIQYCMKHVKAAAVSSVEGEEEKKQVQGEEDKKQVEGEEDKEAKQTTELNSWAAEFMEEEDYGTIFQLMFAANYLNVKGLLDLLAQTVADHIKDKTPEEIRTIFKIENDFTQEEEEEVRKEIEWAFK